MLSHKAIQHAPLRSSVSIRSGALQWLNTCAAMHQEGKAAPHTSACPMRGKLARIHHMHA
eukprot:500605-Pelagomonas_calceolata.AAC.1